jgi:uncharacterized protein (DUF305 family)
MLKNSKTQKIKKIAEKIVRPQCSRLKNCLDVKKKSKKP